MTAVPDTSCPTTTTPDEQQTTESAARSGPNLATLAQLRGLGRNRLLLPGSGRARRS